jgi:hypothetical protein
MVQLEINGRALMMTDCRARREPARQKPQGFNLQLVVADGDAWWPHALAAGCAVVMPFERMFWGDPWNGLILLQPRGTCDPAARMPGRPPSGLRAASGLTLTLASLV